MELRRIDREKGYFHYAIEAGAMGCVSFDTVVKVSKALATELCRETPVEPRYNAERAWAGYDALVTEAKERHQLFNFRSKGMLTPELIGLEGKKVEVRFERDGGKTLRSVFRVGKSNGWMPCHLALKRKCSRDGGPVYGKIKSVKVVENA